MIRIYMAELKNLPDRQTLSERITLNVGVKREAWSRMREEQSRASMAGILLLETALCEQGINLDGLTVLCEPLGRPYLEGATLDFSISHTDSLAVCAVDFGVNAVQARLGVDVERISEAQYMARILRESGVPDGAIVLDEEARTTLENMICGALAISRSPGFHRVSRVCVVTSEWHLRRSLSLAEAFLPRHVTLTGLAAPSGDCSRRRWQTCAESVARVENELWLIWRFVRAKMIGDVEY